MDALFILRSGGLRHSKSCLQATKAVRRSLEVSASQVFKQEGGVSRGSCTGKFFAMQIFQVEVKFTSPHDSTSSDQPGSNSISYTSVTWR